MYNDNKYRPYASIKEAKESSVRNSIEEMITALNYIVKSDESYTFNEYEGEMELIIKNYNDNYGIVYRLEEE